MSKETYLYRVAQSTFYERDAYIFAIDHYVQQENRDDEFSKKLMYFYKHGNRAARDFFMKHFIRLVRNRFQQDERDYDYMTLYPTHQENGFNEHMETLLEGVAAATNIPFKKVLRRSHTIEPSHQLETVDDRKENVKSSIEITEDITEDNVLVIDNVSISGISLIDATNLLYEKGAKNVVCACLGLSQTGKERDYADLNQTMGAKRIIETFEYPDFPENEQTQKERL